MRSEAAASAAHFGAGDGHGSDFDAPDDADDLDDPLEFEAWRVRELARATREKDARELAATDEAETERRRALTPEARAREDRETGKGAKPEKAERRFLQKYHHKGAFYMDDDTLAKAGDGDVRKRATDGPTGADKFDRAALPSVLQVKDFGFAGRTKYTHLTDQDTTFLDKDNPFNGWAQRKAGDPLRKKFDDKMGGVGDIDKAFQRKAKR
ncbi:micro-fibrillar-associated protein 1 [Pelagophyceae sp. CCMP2097]|nr:micro-fibrillar-associated protein 1 [Pelagophyceae sp. CCMP2097]